jgi:hypothetical protein
VKGPSELTRLSFLATGGTEADAVTLQAFLESLATQAFVSATLGAPSGTKILFQQTAAPTGWTKDTTHNDKALRVISGTVSSGGSSPFSTVFGKTATDSTTLTAAHIPTTVIVADAGGNPEGTSSASQVRFVATNSAGGNGHTHPMDIRVNYVDVVICTKDA